MKKALKVVSFNLLAVFLLLALFEGALYLLVRHPALVKHCPKGIRNSVAYLHAAGERRIVQFMPECARHDPQLGYTLKPGACRHTATEFSNEYRINRLGLRDDETSLDQPEVIVLGDSFAMGWGVEQEDSFAQVLERRSGMKVLNAAVSSYGTAREMLLLGRLDTSRLRYLVIQYCENDEEENRAFLLSGNTLKTMGRDTYDRLVAEHNPPGGYYAGKYLGIKLEKKWREFRQSQGKARTPGPANALANKDDVEVFLHALMNGPVDLSRVQVIVFEATGKDDLDRDFVRRLAKRIGQEAYPPYVKALLALDVTKVLTKNDYYVLDEHWTPAGHRAVGEAVWEAIRQTGRK
jgi:lysophospholipase L1-like esterase